MKVQELINKLSEFNPDAEVMIETDIMKEEIIDFAWYHDISNTSGYGGDCSEEDRNIIMEKQTCDVVFINTSFIKYSEYENEVKY